MLYKLDLERVKRSRAKSDAYMAAKYPDLSEKERSVGPCPEEIEPGCICYYEAGLNGFHILDGYLGHVKTAEVWKAAGGVCDNYQQVLAKHADLVNDPDKQYLVLLTPVFKGHSGGWRWEKWGEYIGTQNSRTDYLDDEPEIEMVCIYTIHEVIGEVDEKS